MSLPTGLSTPIRSKHRRRRSGGGIGAPPRRPGWPRPMFLVGLAVMAAVLIAAVTVWINREPGQTLGQSVTTTVANLLEGGQPENVLLIGNNARHASTPLAPGQADLLFVMHFAPAKHTVTFISVPRDALMAFPTYRIPIPKVKSALAMGGPALEVGAVSRLLGMPIKGYVVADFAGFAAAIDAAGGVWIDIPARLYDPAHSRANFEPGYQHLNGSQALAYVRIRQNQAGNAYRMDDYQRMDASYALLAALKRQVLSRVSPSTLSRLANVWRSDAATNLSTSQLLGLMASADHATFRHITVGGIGDSMTLPTTALPGANLEGTITGADYDVLTSQEIETALAGLGARSPSTGLPPLPSPTGLAVAITNSANGQALSAKLRTAGFSVTLGGVPMHASGVLIAYPPGDLLGAEAVGRASGLGDEVLKAAAVPQITVETP